MTTSDAANAAPLKLYVPTWTGERIIPRRIVIEPVFGCNATCGMCPIDHPTRRKKGMMPLDKYKQLVDKLAPYKDTVKMFDLFGLGEPLLDPQIMERVRYAREAGFRNLSFSTNAHLLSADKQQALLESGIETLIFSIDGFKAATHEAIRPRTKFDRVVGNCLEMIGRRNAGNYKTRFVVRFVHQPSNAAEWEDYRAFWLSRLSLDRRDVIIRYDVHDWSGQVDGITPNRPDGDIDPIAGEPCHHIFEKLVILADGSVALCFEDILEAQFNFGNVFEEDPIDIFNSPRFNKLRTLHRDGKRGNLNICGHCSVLYAERTRLVIEDPALT